MKNTPENKAKFFAQYWGQNVLKVPQFLEGFLQGYCTVRIGSDSRWNVWVEKGFLELKPLSQITDEDAIEVAKIHLGWSDSCTNWKQDDRLVYAADNPEVVDFLRSKGYAVPFLGISVEQQMEWGWVKFRIEQI